MRLFGKLLNSVVQGIDNLAKSMSEHCEYRYYLGTQEFLTSALLVTVNCNENGQQVAETALITGANKPSTVSGMFSEKKMLLDWFQDNAPETFSKITEIVGYTNGVMVCPKCRNAEYKRGSEAKKFSKRKFVNGEPAKISVTKQVQNSDGTWRKVTQSYDSMEEEALPLMCSGCGTKYVEDTSLKLTGGTYDAASANQIAKVVVYQRFDVEGVTDSVDERFLYHVAALKGICQNGEEVDLMDRIDKTEIFKANFRTVVYGHNDEDTLDNDDFGYHEDYFDNGRQETLPLLSFEEKAEKLFHPVPEVEYISLTYQEETQRALAEEEDVDWV